MKNWFLNLNMKKKILLGNALAISLLLIFAVTIYVGVNALLTTAHWVAHTEKVIAVGHKISEQLINMETGERGFLITGNREFLEPYEKSRRVVFKELDNARNLVTDNPEQVGRLDEIEKLANTWLRDAGEAEINMRKEVLKGTTTMEELQKVLGEGKGKQLMDKIRVHLGKFISVEEVLIEERRAEAESSAQKTILVVVLGSLISIGLILGIGWVIADSISKQLYRFVSAAEAIAGGDLSNSPEGPRRPMWKGVPSKNPFS